MNAVYNAACVAALVFGLGSLAWAATFGMRALLKDFSPLQQPDGTSPSNPPTEGSLLSPTEDCAVRRQRRVVPSDPRTLSTTLSPGWRFQ